MKDDDDDTVRAGETNNYQDQKKFPRVPTMWDKFKEGFQPTETRIQLDAIRKRRQSANNY